MKPHKSIQAAVLLLSMLPALPSGAQEPSVRVGHICATLPTGMAMVVNDRAGMLIEPQYSTRPQDVAFVPPGTTAPDASYLQTKFIHQGANITLTWGKSGTDAIIATFDTNQAVEIGLRMKRSWQDFPSTWWPVSGGVDGYLVNGPNGYLSASVRTSPAPIRVDGNHAGEVTLVVQLTPGNPLRLVAGVGELPGFDGIAGALAAAEENYARSRITATGDWGGFPQAIADVMNFSRTYSTFDHASAHIVGRGWWIYGNNGNNPDLGPYFCWDAFFNGNLAVLEDPEGARETIRTVLAYQMPDGFVANFARWEIEQDGAKNFCSSDRSQPPVGAMSVWKMHERWPDTAFLNEIYPKLVRWHQWWPTARDGNNNGLLEWGSAKGTFEFARLETGWDDTPHFNGAPMVGTQMAADAVDLNALYSMDAFYLSKIAAALGKTDEAQQFLTAHQTINQRINDELWNESLGLYCSRLWSDHRGGGAGFLTRITPMNFYPLGCAAPDNTRAQTVLQYLYNPDKFWGQWILPTLPYDDPEWSTQHYWKGQIWAPANWLVWQGVKRYAEPAQRAEFVRRSMNLFMSNWNAYRQSPENYRSDTGLRGDHPNYTWGALLALIGVEALCDVDENQMPLPNNQSGITETITLNNIPFGGHLYRIKARGGVVTVSPMSERDGTLEWAGSSTGLGTGTSNTWDAAASANWWDGANHVNWPPSGTSLAAIFGGSAGTVTVNGTVAANDVSFNTTGYSLTGGSLELNGTAPSISTGSGVDATVSSVITGSAGWAKKGGGKLTLTETNTHTGGTTLSGGTLVLANNAALGPDTLSMSGGSLQAGVSPTTAIPNEVAIEGSVGNAFNAPTGFNLELQGDLTGNGVASTAGEWAVALGGDNTEFAGTWVTGAESPNNITRFDNAASGSPNALWLLNGGRMVNGTGGVTTIHLGALGGTGGILSNNTAGQVTFSVGGLNSDTTFRGTIENAWGGGGTTAITKTGTGRWTLGGNNSFSGGTTISSGTIIAAHNSALGTGSVMMLGGALQAGLSPATALSNNIQIDGACSFAAPLSYNLMLNGNLTGSGTVSATGQWAVGLGGDNSGFTGTWINGSENPLNLTSFASANSGSASAAWTLNDGRMVNATSGSPTIQLGALGGSGGILSNNVPGQVTFSIGGLNTDSAFSGQIQNAWGGGGTTAITKTGTGKLTLTGNSSNTGPTSVTGGTLEIHGSLGNTPITVTNAALAGNGSVGGAVQLQTGGNLATRILDWTGSAGAGFDDLSVPSLAIQPGTPHIVIVNAAAVVSFSESAKVFPFLVTTAGITGFNAADFSVSAPGFPGTGTWSVQQNGNTLELVYAAGESAYHAWATEKNLTELNNEMGLDPDNDGLSNLLEFAFDGDPLNPANEGKRFVGLVDPDGDGPEGTALYLTLPVRTGAVFHGPGDLVSDPVSGIIYQIQGSNDLADFTSTDVFEVSPTLADGLPALSPGWTYRTFRRPGPVGESNPSGFLRSVVVQAP